MARGGFRPGAGRKAGRLTDKDRIERDAAMRSGTLPLEYMLKVMRSHQASPSRRDDMAKAAAPYLHAKLQSIEHTGKDGNAIQISDVTRLELARRIGFLLQQGMLTLAGNQPAPAQIIDAKALPIIEHIEQTEHHIDVQDDITAPDQGAANGQAPVNAHTGQADNEAAEA